MPFLRPLLLTIFTLGTLFSLATKPTSAQELPPLPIQFDPDTLINPGRPGGRRRGGGSRGGCQADLPLSAIAYANTSSSTEFNVSVMDETVGTLTTQAQPTLWFYLPQPLSTDTKTTFGIQNGNGETLYTGQLIGNTDDAGIVSAPLANTPVFLEAGTPYQWFLILECEGESNTVNGWVERRMVESDLTQALTQVNARSRAALYANYGYLQDAISDLALLRLSEPEDEAIAQDWVNFLSALDLTDLTAAPLLNCCQIADAQAPIEQPELQQTEPTEPESVPEQIEVDEETDTRTILQRARDKG
ncbi:MAG: DUF928 domain-containing protein [Phormidesmis sp.]